jgi:hypothetical protein
VTQAQARGVADAILVSAGVAAAVVIMTNPRLRRAVLDATHWWLGGRSIGGYLAAEAGRAWAESGRDIMSR